MWIRHFKWASLEALGPPPSPMQGFVLALNIPKPYGFSNHAWGAYASNHVPITCTTTCAGMIKSYQKYQFWAGKVFIIPPSSGALAFHGQIISPDRLGVLRRAKSEAMNNFYVEWIIFKKYGVYINLILEKLFIVHENYSLLSISVSGRPWACLVK